MAKNTVYLSKCTKIIFITCLPGMEFIESSYPDFIQHDENLSTPRATITSIPVTLFRDTVNV